MVAIVPVIPFSKIIQQVLRLIYQTTRWHTILNLSHRLQQFGGDTTSTHYLNTLQLLDFLTNFNKGRMFHTDEESGGVHCKEGGWPKVACATPGI